MCMQHTVERTKWYSVGTERGSRTFALYCEIMVSALYTCQLVQFHFKHKHLNKRLISNGSHSQNIMQSGYLPAHRTAQKLWTSMGGCKNTVILFFK